MKKRNTHAAYEFAKEQYANYGVDTEKALKLLSNISISLHCWQGDDVTGFEPKAGDLTGGIAVTGNHQGKARNISELRMDIEKVLTLLPGNHRLNLHAIYGDFGKKYIDRNEITPAHYKSWVDWAKSEKIKLDFNATCFSHPKADGFTLSSKDKAIREFWIEHVRRCREITAYFGKELKSASVHNLWIPDGMKDMTVDKFTYRSLLKESLDAIYKTKLNSDYIKDSVESKLFGIGSESFVVGSHEFYMGYALQKKLMMCLDMGHFHPTESIADKISALLLYSDELMLHVSRGIRWDSDHIVILNDDVRELALEIVRANALKRINIGLDFFDASVNRLGAWVIGARSTLKAFLFALLEPSTELKKLEGQGKYIDRLAILEDMKTMPFDAVWNYYCEKENVATGKQVLEEINKYEKQITIKR